MSSYQAGGAHHFAGARAEGTGFLTTIPGGGLTGRHRHTAAAGTVATCQVAAAL